MRGRPKNIALVPQETSPEDNGRNSSAHTVQSVERTLDILEALARAGRPVTLSELSHEVGLHVSTVHRLLATLIERGYARQEAGSGRYTVGSRLLELASGVTDQIDVRAEARPILEKLSSQIGETANLSVRSGDNLVYIDQVQTERLVRMFTRVGSSAPLYCTGAGKLFLAYAGSDNFEHEFNRYLLENRLEPRTSQTIIKPQALREELRRIRERGYSFDNEEMEEGVICVAAPIFDRSGQIAAAISVSGPSSRLKEGHISEAIKPVLDAANEISSRLGHRAR